MAGGGNGKEQNYWPGFVDVLSNVVLTLVFVLVVFVMALALSANKVEKRMQEILKEKAASEAKLQPVQATKGATDIEHNESGAAKKNDTITSSGNIEIENNDTTQKSGTKVIDAPVDLQESSGKIILYYPVSGVELSEKTAEKLEKILLANKEKLKRYKIVLNSYLGQEQYSVANRLAYYRVLYVRKFLIDKGIADNQSITSKILQPEKSDVGHVEIILEKN
jgi:hypothetical protein